jgi:hypothetical protein
VKVQAEKKMDGMIGAQAMQWLREQTDAAREFFSGVEGHGAYALAQDGGEPVAGLMKHYDSAAWGEFQHRFLDIADDAEGRVSMRSNQ